MTRMIERWFPCAEVSEASYQGWGSGNAEKSLFPWFAARPIAQAKAAVLTSLLPWPEDEAEQKELQQLVRAAMCGPDAEAAAVTREIAKAYPEGAAVLDLFSGRGMIPVEAARLGVQAFGLDYSPVATLAGTLLADFPMRDWSGEPPLPFESSNLGMADSSTRLSEDVRTVFHEIGRRFEKALDAYYPRIEDKRPWGYLWAMTLPCQECGRRFPLVGSLALRAPNQRKNDSGQSFSVSVDRADGTFSIEVHDGMPREHPTLTQMTRGGKRLIGKSAICPFCEHVHPKPLHARLAAEGLGRDRMLAVADIDATVGKVYRIPTAEELIAASAAEAALNAQPDFAPGLPAVPDERIPIGNSDTIRASAYGAKTYGDLCNARQTLAFVTLSRIIASLGDELSATHGVSRDYATALTGYAGAALARKLRRSTRGCALDPKLSKVHDIFKNESVVGFSHDYFEAGIGSGPGTWTSLADSTASTLERLIGKSGAAATIERGTAVSVPYGTASMSVVVTDPPYDDMIAYSDASDMFYVWLKRALHTTFPDMAFTADPDGVQEKADEIIVKRFRAKRTAARLDHRTKEHYDSMISRAFSEARRVVSDNGVVTIVFGHGDPEVWHRLLSAISHGGLVLTGSWPAKTEAGGSGSAANIVTTVTMSCRPAPKDRPVGRAHVVEDEIRAEVKARVPAWDAAGLAAPDQRMASAGPAMEVFGRYSKVLNNLGEEVEADRYLILARRAVDEAAAIEIDHLPLETFDALTRFALSWTRLYGRGIAAKSEARWESLAAEIAYESIKVILKDEGKGVRLMRSDEFKAEIDVTSPVVCVALAMAAARADGLDAVAEVLAASGRNLDDPYLWAAMGFLSSRLPEADSDAMAWTGLVRDRKGIGSVTRQVVTARKHADELAAAPTLFDDVDGVNQ